MGQSMANISTPNTEIMQIQMEIMQILKQELCWRPAGWHGGGGSGSQFGGFHVWFSVAVLISIRPPLLLLLLLLLLLKGWPMTPDLIATIQSHIAT